MISETDIEVITVSKREILSTMLISEAIFDQLFKAFRESSTLL